MLFLGNMSIVSIGAILKQYCCFCTAEDLFCGPESLPYVDLNFTFGRRLLSQHSLEKRKSIEFFKTLPFLVSSQLDPLQLAPHAQWKVTPSSVQDPPFLQGLVEHGSENVTLQLGIFSSF